MSMLSDIGGSQAGTSLADYLQRRRMEGLAMRQDERAGRAEAMNLKLAGQRMKMNEQLMDQRSLQLNVARNELKSQQKEQQRRGQVTLFNDFLERVPTGPESGPAKMYAQIASQHGFVRPDGKTEIGFMEDLQKYIKSDPELSTQMAMLNEQHWTNESNKIKEALSSGEMKDKEAEEANARLQEVEQKKNIAIQSNEQLSKINQKRVAMNNEILKTFDEDVFGWIVQKYRQLGGTGVPNMVGVKGNPNSPETRMVKQSINYAMQMKSRKEAAERQAKKKEPTTDARKKQLENEYSKTMARVSQIESRTGITASVSQPELSKIVKKEKDRLKKLKKAYKEIGGNLSHLGAAKEIVLPKNITDAKTAVKWLGQEHGMSEQSAIDWLKETGKI